MTRMSVKISREDVKDGRRRSDVMRRMSLVLLSTLVFAGVGVAGCAPSDKSAELQQLEQLLQDPEAQSLRTVGNAARYHQEARDYRRLAEEARQERRADRSTEYAVLGLIRYRTAVAVARQFEAAERLQEANARIEEINPVLKGTSQARNELARDIQELDDKIRAAVRDREQERRRSQAQAEPTGFEPRQQAMAEQSADLLTQINQNIAQGRELRKKALEVKADEYDRTRGVFRRADEQFSRARELLSEQPEAADAANRQIAFALQLFEEAYELAEPIHAEYTEKMRPDNRINGLRQKARNNFGGPFTQDEYNGTRIIMARLFVPQETGFRRNTETVLNVLTELATEFEEFDIQIYGFTQRRGNATENLGISQVRAQQVRDLLVNAGVDSSRISTEGFGQDQQRFDDSPDNNDRVEVIFRHSNP